jgi:Family of unknown function (DUF6335)
MAKRKAARRVRPVRSARKQASSRSSAKRAAPEKGANKRGTARKASKTGKPRRIVGSKTKPAVTPLALGPGAQTKSPRLDRVRRTLEDTVPTPPSSLDMDRRGSAVRTAREELAESRREHKGMSPEIAGGDLDVDIEDAYFTGEESPGGDNPTPDQDIVDDIGRALGVEYEDSEELKGSDKVTKRDKHRWELDPASSEDYKDRK